MIITASRRTDIPAFYTPWLINRLRHGHCTVPNPINLQQVSRISLRPEDVDVLILCSRNPRPLFKHLEELDAHGFRYYFHITLMDNPRLIDHKAPALEAALQTFRQFAGRVGAQRMIWRYDPLVFSEITPPDFHRQTFERIAEALRGNTRRVMVSILDMYAKARRRLLPLEQQGARLIPFDPLVDAWFGSLMRDLAGLAEANDMEIVSCAEQIDLRPYGILPGKCVDDDYIRQIFNLKVTQKKNPGMRPACGCVDSRDIGMYDSCLFGCQYCYATNSFEQARHNHARHDPSSPSLLGWYEPSLQWDERQMRMF